MRIEAFTEAKAHGAPDTNEDALVVLPGRAFAVLDGVTDRVGTRYEGMLSGRYASRLLARTLEEVLKDAVPDDPWAPIAACTEAIRRVYDRHGSTEQVRHDWNRQMAATLALVMLGPDHAHVVLVGDSGVRLNGTTLWQENKDIDLITATLRQHAWAVVAGRTDDTADRERISRAVCWSGAAHAAPLVAPLLREDDLRTIAQDAAVACQARLPHLAAGVVAAAIANGIIHGQGGHQNNPESPLGYPSLNGFPIPRGLVRIERVPRAGLHTAELFSDGYFAPGDAFGVDSWEAKFRGVERCDPHKIGAYPSVKGSTAANYADDRTYLGVVL